MSLLIKGMSMPKSCEECPCREYPEFSFESDWCCLNKKTISDVKVISPNCPFIKIPASHGRLIDCKSKSFPIAFGHELTDYAKGWNACLRSVLLSSTIIEAEVNE